MELEWDIIKLLVRIDTNELKLTQAQNKKTSDKGGLAARKYASRLKQDAAFYQRKLKAKKIVLMKLNAKVYKNTQANTEKKLIDLLG